MQTKYSWGRVLNAFWRALQMTMRGQTYTPPAATHPELRAWIERAKELVQDVFQAADANGLDESARKQRSLPLEGRPMTMQTILAAVQHNLAREYPSLLDSGLEHSILTLVAFNMNDHYRLTKLAESLDDTTSVQSAVRNLDTHLASMPQTGQNNRPQL